MFSWDFVLRFVNITLIDLVLSGDNALVIGIAAAALPFEKRKRAIIIGGAGAIVLRIILTSVATLLMLIPFISIIGGLVLIWVAYKLMRMDVCETEIEEVNKACVVGNFRQAIFLILTADFMMSLDNVIAIAGTAHGSIGLLIAGLLISMPLLMITGGFISTIIDRFKWLINVGAFAIIFTAVRMVFDDGLIESRLHVPIFLELSIAAGMGLALVVFFILVNRRRSQQASPVMVKDGHEDNRID